MRRWKAFTLAAALVVAAAGGYAAYWVVTARILEGVVTNWAEAQRAHGYKVEIGEPRVQGFPVAFRMRFEAPVIEAPPEAGGWRWQGAPLTAEAAITNPWQIRFAAPGHHVLTAPLAGGLADWEADAREAEGWVHLEPGGGLEEAGIGISGLDLRLPGGGMLGVAATHLSVDPRRGPPDRPQEEDLAVRLTIEGLELPGAGPAGLGHRLARLHLDALVRGALPPGPAAEALQAWRDAGGVLEVRRLATEWGDLRVTTDGTLSLDKRMQPTAAGVATIRGLDAVIDDLAEASVIGAQEARLAALASAALTKPASDGDREVRLPISIQERTVFLGPLRLFRLPEIHW
ncbi:MAG: DUF2125 domain-containing protein [Rhodospirillaceae bacterium]|nr:DUF2125 domain-containing protein [Rhodospirillaceae bacterium]